MLNQAKLLWSFMSPLKLRYLGILFLSFLLALIECVFLMLLLPLLDSFTKTSSTAHHLSSLNTRILKIVSLMPWDSAMINVCMLIVFVAFVRFFIKLTHDFSISKTSGFLMADLRQKIFQQYAYTQLSEILTQKQGKLMHHLTTSPNLLASTLSKVPHMVASFMTSLSIAILLCSIHWKMTLGIFVSGSFFYFVLLRLCQSIAYKIGKEFAKSCVDLNTTINEFLTGIKQIVVSNARPIWKDFNRKISQKLSRYYVLTSVFTELPRTFIDLGASVFIVSIIIGIQVLFNEDIFQFLPILALFFVAFLRLSPQMSIIANSFVIINTNMPEFEAIRKILSRTQSVAKEGKDNFKTLKNEIGFYGVGFAHKNRNALFNSISFVIKKNEITAIVGGSGSGKSTLINLILGLYEPSQGVIKIDSVNLQDLNLTSWRSKIGFVSQDSFIFHSSIADNISFYDEKYSQSDIEEATKTANAHDFIMSFPQGYQTIVGERGMQLSGGQQQRIAIARAVIRKPEIFIFDEATSSLDPVSEKSVQNDIQAVSKGHTTIIISHRLSTIKNADHILVLKEGNIVEEGNHQNLINLKSGYWELHQALEKGDET